MEEFDDYSPLELLPPSLLLRLLQLLESKHLARVVCLSRYLLDFTLSHQRVLRRKCSLVLNLAPVHGTEALIRRASLIPRWVGTA